MQEYNSKNGNLKMWYFNTYNSLGYKWLTNVLKYVCGNEEKTVISSAANFGEYEKMVLQNDLPNLNFKLFDVSAEIIDHNKSFDRYDYCINNTDASYLMYDKRLIGKVDVVMDIKGALWYATNSKRPERMIRSILESYYTILKPDGCLVIDSYETKEIENFINVIIWSVLKYKTKKKNVKCFGEKSTLHVLNKSLEGYTAKISDVKRFKEKEIGKPLSSKMETCIITKDIIGSILKDLLI